MAYKVLPGASLRHLCRCAGRNVHVAGVDIGTSSIKAGIIDKKGILASYRKIRYEEIGGDIYNWKTDFWVNSLKKALKELPLLEKAEAVVFSGSGPSVIPICRDGNYMAESLLWLDNKKTDIADNISFFLPKIAWYKENRKDIYANVSCFLTLSGFFPYLLTGELKEPLPNKEFTPYIWTEDSIKKAGLELTLFPQFVFAGNLVGYVSEKSSREFYLRKGIPVFAGASDYLMALLGTGALFEGAVCDRAGTSEGINYCTKKNVKADTLRILPHIIEDFYNVSGVIDSSGKNFSWFKKISGQEEKSYSELIGEISKVIHNDDSLYFLPSARFARALHVSRRAKALRPYSQGALCHCAGTQPASQCCSPDLGRNSLWKYNNGAFTGLEVMPEAGAAVLKAIGFSVCEVIRIMESHSLAVEEIRLSGGQAEIPLWNQVKADMTGKKLLAPEVKDSELIGCACVAFTGLGVYNSLTQASQEMVRIKDVYTPDAKAYSGFCKLFEDYSDILRKFELFANSL